MKRSTFGFFLIVPVASLLMACNFAPKYHPPIVESAPRFKELTPEQAQQLEKWHAAAPIDSAARGKWWELFGDEKLNALEARAVITNQTVAAAVARVEAAR